MFYDFTIPDHLVCRISFELMEEPLTTPAGNTYESSYLRAHISKNGAFDPCTRQNFDQKLLIKNHILKKAIKNFLYEHPWAFQFDDNLDFKTITLY